MVKRVRAVAHVLVMVALTTVRVGTATAQSRLGAAQPGTSQPGQQAGTPQPGGAPSELSLQQAMTLAMQRNPSLIAARLGRAVAAAEINVARGRPNPDFTFERERETPFNSVALTQPIELGGKRGRRIDVAEATAATNAADIARTEIDVRAEVRRAFYEAVAAERRVALARELADLAQRARDAAQARVDAGDAPRLELLQAELGLARAQNDLATRDGERVASKVELNALLGLLPATETIVRGELTEGAVPDASAAVTRAMEASLDLVALDRRIREAEARVALARALRMPDLSVSGTLTQGAPGEFDYGYRYGFTLNVPIFTTHRAGVVREDSAVAQARAEREAAAAHTSAAVTAAVARAQALRQRIDREERDILPRARQVEAMAEDSYRSGQTGLVALLQTLQTTRDTRLQALDTALTYQHALADLERAIGAPLP
jgi:cobalt-zinc-cadmium efflux system outer membrane protein